jgi:CRISPR-associated protein Cst1
MKNEDYNIDSEWLTKMTGDPFSDTGGLVIKFLREQKQYSNMDIAELIKFVANIYVNNWGAKLNAFFLNSPITQPAFNNQRKIEETVKYYNRLINETAEFKEGFCRVTGKQTKVYYAGRDNHIMSGSGAFINFHHGYETGIYFSKEILIRTFFIPFGLMQLGGKIALIHTDNEEVNYFFISKNIKENIRNIGSNNSEGVLKSEFNNPSNAIFDFAEDCAANIELIINNENTELINESSVTISLYLFTNFGASPDIEIYKLPAIFFKLITHLNKHFREEWKNFIWHHYHNSKFKNAKFNSNTNTWVTEKESVDFNTYKIWSNYIYDNLLRNSSIIPYFLKWSKLNKFNFKIVELYCRNILNMEQKTLQKIRDLADFIVQNPDASKIQKVISRLNSYKKSQEFRQFILRLIRENYVLGNSQTLVTLEEYVDYLFPDGTFWTEIRNLLLIAIYQKLHELPDLKVELEEIDDDDFNINNLEEYL